MDFEDQLGLEHLLLKERKCRSCGKIKDLMEDFYLTRKNRTYFNKKGDCKMQPPQSKEYRLGVLYV